MLCARAGQRAPAGSLLREWRGRERARGTKGAEGAWGVGRAGRAGRAERACRTHTWACSLGWRGSGRLRRISVAAKRRTPARGQASPWPGEGGPKKARAAAHRRPHGGGEGSAPATKTCRTRAATSWHRRLPAWRERDLCVEFKMKFEPGAHFFFLRRIIQDCSVVTEHYFFADTSNAAPRRRDVGLVAPLLSCQSGGCRSHQTPRTPRTGP